MMLHINSRETIKSPKEKLTKLSLNSTIGQKKLKKPKNP
jgi:hypothetical protein